MTLYVRDAQDLYSENFNTYVKGILKMIEYEEILKRMSELERRMLKVSRRIEEIGMQLEALNKTFICLYRYKNLNKCSVTIQCNA